MVIQLDELKKAKKREYMRQWKKNNPEKNRAHCRKHREANKERIAEYHQSYREANKEKLAEYKQAYYEANKDKIEESRRACREANKEKFRERCRAKYAEDKDYRLIVNTRTRIRIALSEAGLKKSTRTIKLLGCNWAEYQQWIESQFTEGMSWDNQSAWHVDHTLPVMPVIKKFGEAALPIVFNYRNCKPMWAEENLSKNDSIPAVQEIHPWVKEQLVALAKEQSDEVK